MINRDAQRTTDHGRRRAYTLIELLVVISIIIVLMGLMLPAVMGVLGRAEDAVTKSEIAQMNVAVEEFKRAYGFYPPSRVVLRGNRGDYNTSSPVEKYSATVLPQRFPNLNRGWTNIDWGCPDGTELDGAQCLVFFLAGPDAKGFGAINPAEQGKPVFAFKRDRLQAGTGGLPYYTDQYGQPYLYFSTKKDSANSYTLDCPQLQDGAYYHADKEYANPNSFQIIAAGRNGRFGNGSSLANMPADAQDNLTNFTR